MRVTQAEITEALDDIAGQLPGYLIARARAKDLAAEIRVRGLEGDGPGDLADLVADRVAGRLVDLSVSADANLVETAKAAIVGLTERLREIARDVNGGRLELQGVAQIVRELSDDVAARDLAADDAADDLEELGNDRLHLAAEQLGDSISIRILATNSTLAEAVSHLAGSTFAGLVNAFPGSTIDQRII